MSQNTSRKLEGKVAVVSGGSRGIGQAIVKSFAEHGASVVINYTSSAKQAETLVDQIKASGGQAIAVQADIGSLNGPKAIVDAAVEAFGKIDIIVNNAGVAEFAVLGGIDTQVYDKVYNVNVRGPLLLVQESLPHLQEFGRVINITSTAARSPSAGGSVYGGSKGALESMSRVWASELAAKNITSNSINPGPVDTDMSKNVLLQIPEEQRAAVLDQFVSRALFKRPASVEEIASVALFVASPDSQWITGDVLNANGGLLFP